MQVPENSLPEPLEPAGLFRRHGASRCLSVPDVVLPLVLAGEIAYVGLLGTHPKFQSYVDAQAAKVAPRSEFRGQPADARPYPESLPQELLQRFQTLRTSAWNSGRSPWS